MADSQERAKRYWSSRFDLLPVTCGKTMRDHIFLSIVVSLSNGLDSAAKGFEEFPLVNHILAYRIGQAKTPRAE